MATYLLDSTVFIQMWNRYARAQAWMDEALARRDRLATTVINVGETYSGARPEERPAWQQIFSRIPVWPVTVAEAVWGGQLRYESARRGFQLHLPDVLIAAVAVAHDATIVTANEKDFRRMGLEIVFLPD